MDIDTRLKALARLAKSPTDSAQAALAKELDQAAEMLETQVEYDLLEQSLKVLDVIAYRFSERAVYVIANFIQTIEARPLSYSHADDAFADYVAKYSNAQTLIIKAIEILTRLRYHETRSVVRILLGLDNHSSEGIRKKVRSGLHSVAKYDLDAFYGADRRGGIGPAPQSDILEELESMDVAELKAHRESSLQLLEGLLSPTMEAVTWSSNAATLSHGATPALPSVADIRKRSIQCLRRMYGLAASVSEKLAVITVLNGAARTDHRGNIDEETSEMIAGDACEVLAFYAQLVPTEHLQIVQRIESNSYWIYVHAHRDEISIAALAVERVIAAQEEYAIYRVLVGFEGIFGDWSTLNKSRDHIEAIEKDRRQKASDFAGAITGANYDEWRTRILAYGTTDSDDLATFPVFYHFLSEFATARPELALRLITEDTKAVALFLIPILVSLWDGPYRDATRALIEKWINDAQHGQQHYLFASTKMFLSAKDLDFALLKQLLEKADEVKDISSVRQVVTVTIARYQEAGVGVLQELLYPALEVLTSQKDASWIFDAWFRKEARQLFAKLDAEGVEHVFRNLMMLTKIDYHAEEVLSLIAQREPERVMDFLCQRLALESKERSDDGTREFQAIPFEFHKLQESLSKIARVAVHAVLKQFRLDASLFTYRGATLLKNIFPNFSEEFEAELLRLVREGGETNLAFVVGILRSYHGEPFIHRICKEIVKAVPGDNPLRNEVAIALETTGVVSGEFGMAEAYERKRQEVLDWLADPDERVKSFAKRYITDLEKMRDAERKRAEEGIALRKFRFGEE